MRARGWLQLALLTGACLTAARLTAANPPIVDAVLQSFSTGSDARALALLASYRSSRGVTPEYLEAFSWVARAHLSARNYLPAEKIGQEIYALSLNELKKRPLDAEPHLAQALGAAIEVHGEVLTAVGRRTEALTYLQEQAQVFGSTSILARIRKNVLLLSLEGKPAPALDGVTLPKGKPMLLFFWAHWCPDCKAEAPILEKIKSEFAADGLVIVGPTQKYGYVAGGVDAAAATEVAYIEQVRAKYYARVVAGPAPVSAANFTRYGASTTPTLVLVDRAGIVRMYHPGALKYEDLKAAVKAVIVSK